MKTVMLVFGTRPEAIKMCPLVNELKSRESIKTVVCVTGQHRQMLDMVLDAFNVKPDYDLSIMKEKQTLFDITSNILLSIKSVLEEVKPDVVLVHGDTSTTFVTALACFYMHFLFSSRGQFGYQLCEGSCTFGKCSRSISSFSCWCTFCV